jgi:hypothetical protein
MRPVGSGQSSAAAARGELSGAGLFTLLWESLADVLGTAATATLLRRAAFRAAPRIPELAELDIARVNLDYQYTLPSTWKEREAGTMLPLRELVGELRPLLVEMTGQVVVRHLEKIPELRERGILSPQEGQK